MKIGIVGLGLIGGSLAKAYRVNPGFRVFGEDSDRMIEDFARLCGAVDGTLDDDALRECDLILIAVNPRPAVEWLERHAHLISPDALVMDCCGVKRAICEAGFRLAAQHGFEFVGGHPMAGIHRWGFKYSRADLFEGACMVVVPRTLDDTQLLERVKRAVLAAGFGSISATTAQRHDKLIAFTSQMPHLLSNAYIKSPAALEHRGFSAGSYQDMTRVAWLNPTMWAELFLENRDCLIQELDLFLEALGQYRRALDTSDQEALQLLLDEGRIQKQRVDGT